VTDWLTPEVPHSWTPPATLVDRMVLAPELKQIDNYHNLGRKLYQATLRCDFSTAHRADIVRAYESTVAARRLSVLGVVLGFVLACLAALAGYIRADEATKGYYTNRLRLVAATAVGAAGVVAYRLVA